MSKKFKCNLYDDASIRELISEIQEYKEELIEKCDRFVKELSDEGISVAIQALGNDEMSKAIIIKMDNIKTDKFGCSGVMVATQTGYITKTWIRDGKPNTVDVSPLLMVEYGSGQYANPDSPTMVDGIKVGRGTFPDQRNAFKESWHWKTEEDQKWHTSKGYKPSMPMYKAQMFMMSKVELVARRVFRS